MSKVMECSQSSHIIDWNEVQLIITLYFQFCTAFVQLSFFSLVCRKNSFSCALKILAVLANKTSAIIQFMLTQFLCYISQEERVAVEVKI